MAAQAVKRVLGMGRPLQRRVKSIIEQRIAAAHCGQATQGGIGRADPVVAPGAARVLADAAEGIDGCAGLEQHDGIVAIDREGTRGKVSLSKNGGVGAGMCKHEHVAGGDGAAEVEFSRRIEQVGVAIVEGLHHILGQVHGGRSRVEDFQRLVVAAAFNVFGKIQFRCGAGVVAQIIEAVLGEAIPFVARLKRIIDCGVAAGHRGLAAQGAILGGGVTAAPGTARILALLPEAVDDAAIFQQ